MLQDPQYHHKTQLTLLSQCEIKAFRIKLTMDMSNI